MQRLTTLMGFTALTLLALQNVTPVTASSLVIENDSRKDLEEKRFTSRKISSESYSLLNANPVCAPEAIGQNNQRRNKKIAFTYYRKGLEKLKKSQKALNLDKKIKLSESAIIAFNKANEIFPRIKYRLVIAKVEHPLGMVFKKIADDIKVNKLSDFHEKITNYDKALKKFNAAIEKDPEDLLYQREKAITLVARAETFHRLGDHQEHPADKVRIYEKAIQDFEAVKLIKVSGKPEINIRFAETLNNRGIMLTAIAEREESFPKKLETYAKAIESLEKANDCIEDDDFYKRNLFTCFGSLGHGYALKATNTNKHSLKIKYFTEAIRSYFSAGPVMREAIHSPDWFNVYTLRGMAYSALARQEKDSDKRNEFGQKALSDFNEALTHPSPDKKSINNILKLKKSIETVVEPGKEKAERSINYTGPVISGVFAGMLLKCANRRRRANLQRELDEKHCPIHGRLDEHFAEFKNPDGVSTYPKKVWTPTIKLVKVQPHALENIKGEKSRTKAF